MTWNYRVLQYKDGSIGVHEAYYRKGEKVPYTITREPIIVGDDVHELISTLRIIRNDIGKYKDKLLKWEDF